MGIRRFVIMISALSLLLVGFGAAEPATAKPLTDYVAQAFTATGTINQTTPPAKVGNDIRIYVDGDNFTIFVTASSPSVTPRIEPNGELGLHTLPGVSQYTLNGQPSDFAGAIVFGCTTTVTGLVLQMPTQVSRDLPMALTVDTTCP